MIVTGALTLPASSGAWSAEKNYGPGVTDTEIKIGQTIAYSGPASSFGTTGHTISAYYRMINDHGGVNGRKINFISADDGYSPPKTCDFWSWVMLTTGHYKCTDGGASEAPDRTVVSEVRSPEFQGAFVNGIIAQESPPDAEFSKYPHDGLQ